MDADRRPTRHSVLSIHRDRTAAPIGTYSPTTTLDGRSLERAGQPVYELRHVDGTVVEVRFADDEWLLCEQDEVRPS